MTRQFVHAVIVRALEKSEEDIGLGVEKDRIVADARLAEQRLKLRPDRVVAAAVLVRMTGFEEHLEGVPLHRRSLQLRQGSAHLPTG